jgi:hypothetical protein
MVVDNISERIQRAFEGVFLEDVTGDATVDLVDTVGKVVMRLSFVLFSRRLPKFLLTNVTLPPISLSTTNAMFARQCRYSFHLHYHVEGQRLRLHVENMLGRGNERHVAVYCPYWIINTCQYSIRLKEDINTTMPAGTVTAQK